MTAVVQQQSQQQAIPQVNRKLLQQYHPSNSLKNAAAHPLMTSSSAAEGDSSSVLADPLDIVNELLVASPPDISKARDVLKTFLRQSPSAHAWRLFLTAHELSTDQPLPDAVHQEWLQSVGMDCAAARLYISVAKHIAGPQRLLVLQQQQQQQSGGGGGDQRMAAIAKAKFLMEVALATPMDLLEEVAKAYEPIAGAASEAAGGALSGGGGGGSSRGGHGLSGASMMSAAVKRKYEAAKAIFDYEGAWPERHNTALTHALHVRAWSATLQRMFSTYCCLATIRATPAQTSSAAESNGEDGTSASSSAATVCVVPKPFPSTVQHHLSLLTNDELNMLKNTQKRRIQLAMRQALLQCPNEDILLVHYCAFVAAVKNSTEEAKAALMAHLNAQLQRQEQLQQLGFATTVPPPASPSTTAVTSLTDINAKNNNNNNSSSAVSFLSPALATLAVALHKIESAADLFQLLTNATASSTIANANATLDLNIIANRKRFREYCNEAKESATERNRWHVFAEWLEVECHTIDNRSVAATIAEKGFERLRVEAAGYGRKEIDALALFAHRAYEMHMRHGKPEQAQLVAEVLVSHLSKQTNEKVSTGTTMTETGRVLASAPVNTLKEACFLRNITDNDEAIRYYEGNKNAAAADNGASALQLAMRHSVGPSLPLLTRAEHQWATIVSDLSSSALRYADDTGYKIPNDLKHRFHKLEQAMPWGLATVDDTLTSDPMVPAIIDIAALKNQPSSSSSAAVATDAASSAAAAEEGEARSGWKPFTVPSNPVLKEMMANNPDSDEIRAPFAIRGVSNRAITVDERTILRQAREEAYRIAEGSRKTSTLENWPTKIVKLIKRLPPTTEGCTRIAETDPMWLMNNALLTTAPLDWDAFVEANRKMALQ